MSALLRTFIALLFLGLIVAQLFSLPGQFVHLAGEEPRLGAIPWLLLGFAELEVACLQATLVCIWRLLGLIESDRIFSDRAFIWVDVLVAAISIAWILLALVSVGLSTFIYVTPELRDPGVPILLVGMTLVGGVVALTVRVMRALLKQAAALRTDLDEVI